ncbi:cyclodeaminase/cyclohydrolase family protein [Saccharopolyspora sp. 6T]|uniref:cyclodeaminase/cyclohydrolase family protein n=1 Tax=Saccharopolyspora sp. 6T TaxID=2877238 RepID=UPI001CD5D560|nr:cyclodeaminase/cyclohydrolase family protein [Saccharopolyspora sp. 6T]MCA1185982.1 cyclodeaminase/cyclohydrolase family protein [Saccharopolyspora sp. 6T]
MTDLDASVREFLDEVAAPTPSATGGVVGAVTTAAAAGLLAMCARLRRDASRASRAEALRQRAVELARADSDAYQDVLAAQRRSADDPGRAAALTEALAGAAGPPARLAELAAEVAALAGEVAAEAAPAHLGNALAAAALAAGAARGAAALVRIDLAAAGADLAPADEAAAHAAAAARHLS